MNTAIRLLLLAAAPFVFALTPLQAQVEAHADPAADPRNVVVDGNVRLTVLTPQLMRLEWAADGRFEDRPSLLFLNRRTPPARGDPQGTAAPGAGAVAELARSKGSDGLMRSGPPSADAP